jgi:hypothetical protein
MLPLASTPSAFFPVGRLDENGPMEAMHMARSYIPEYSSLTLMSKIVMTLPLRWDTSTSPSMLKTLVTCTETPFSSALMVVSFWLK